jgi:hypothetical protein
MIYRVSDETPSPPLRPRLPLRRRYYYSSTTHPRLDIFVLCKLVLFPLDHPHSEGLFAGILPIRAVRPYAPFWFSPLDSRRASPGRGCAAGSGRAAPCPGSGSGGGGGGGLSRPLGRRRRHVAGCWRWHVWRRHGGRVQRCGGKGVRVSAEGKKQESESIETDQCCWVVWLWCGGRPGWRCSLPVQWRFFVQGPRGRSMFT